MRPPRHMKRLSRPPRGGFRDQLVLILGPWILSLVLVALYAGGLLTIGWPALLIAVVLVNLAGDVLLALRGERDIRNDSLRLCNDLRGRRVTARAAFQRQGARYRGVVMLAGERWWADSAQAVAAAESLTVTGRHGLVLEVASSSGVLENHS